MQVEANENQSTTGARGVVVRPLQADDDAAARRFLQDDHGYGLFITGNLLSYGFGYGDVRYWGQFRQHVGAAGQADLDLTGLLMFTGESATLYAPPGVNVDLLIALALQEPLHFIMGRDDLMDVAEAQAPRPVVRTETHYFADLTARRFTRSELTLPAQTSVRRGTLRDIEGLARLYYGATGFEDLTFAQVRNVMTNRVTRLRTFLVERQGEILAAASTSAESYTAAMIGGVWTAPWARGRGISTTVVGALCGELLRERKRPYLFYLTENGPAERVYEKLGFHVTGGWRVIYFAA